MVIGGCCEPSGCMLACRAILRGGHASTSLRTETWAQAEAGGVQTGWVRCKVGMGLKPQTAAKCI